jgi:MYXO-CTERM domain-containing protein
MFFRPARFALVTALAVASSSLVLAADGGDNPPDGGIVGLIDSGAIDSSASPDAAGVSDVAAAAPDLVVAVDALARPDLSLVADAPWTPDVVLSADAPVAPDTSVAVDVPVPVDTFVAIDLAAAVDGGANAGDGGAGDGGSGSPPVYLPDGGTQGWIADDTGCSFGHGRPAGGAALIPLFGLVALWLVRRRGRR